MTVDQRTQTAADLWAWSAEIGAIAWKLRRFQPESGFCQPAGCTRAVRQLLEDASGRLRSRAYEEAGQWRPTYQLARQIGGLFLCLLVGSAVTAMFSLPQYVAIGTAIVVYAGAYLLLNRLTLDFVFHRFDYPATPIPGADETYAAACATEQENGPDLDLTLGTSLRKVHAMLTKIENLARPERAASARFPGELAKAALDTQHFLFGALLLLDAMLDHTGER
jgi:hypothetical protein